MSDICFRSGCTNPAEYPSAFCAKHRPPNNPPPFPGDETGRARAGAK